MNPIVPGWQQFFYFSPLSVSHLYLVNGGVMGWEELDTDVWKNFILVVFFKLVSSVERRILGICK